MSTTVLTVDQLIDSLEATKDDDHDDLYVVLGEPVGSGLDVTFDSEEETAEIESTQGWAFGVFGDDMDAWSLSHDVSAYLFGSLLVEERHLSDDAIRVAQEGGDSA